MKAGIVLDDWKLSVFRRRLTDAGFTYTDAGAFTGDTTTLHVQYEAEQLPELKRVLEEAQYECKQQKQGGV